VRIRAAVVAVAVAGALATAAPAHATTDDYPAEWRTAPLDAKRDTWGFPTRECTSFVAWRMHGRNHVDLPTLGDAKQYIGPLPGLVS